jgi:predicted phage terminase large subunit-like protein
MTSQNSLKQKNLKQKLEIIRALFFDDLHGFARNVLKDHMVLDIPPFHREIYDLITSDKQRVAIAAPRGHAKSTIISLAYTLWNALNLKKKFIIICSDTFPQAKMFLETLKTELETNEFLISLYGQQKTDKWTESDIELKSGVRIMAKGAEMKFRGLKYGRFRPDLIIIDDLENDEMVESRERRQKLERWFNGTLLPSLDLAGQVVYIGTILHDDALLMKVLHKYPGWETKLYQAIQPDGTALWPEHLDLEKLEQIKEDYTSIGQLDLFMAEYMNDPITDESREFKREYFKYYETPPEELKIAITVDPAISKKTHADFSVVYVQGVDKDNNRYCLEYIRKRMDPYELCEAIFQLSDKWKPWTVGIEKVAFQEALIYIMKDEMRKRNKFFKITEISTRSDKTMKIRGLVPMYAAGVMHHRAEHTALEEELLRFPKGVHDDVIDAQAMQQELVRKPMQHQQIVRQYDRLTGY